MEITCKLKFNYEVENEERFIAQLKGAKRAELLDMIKQQVIDGLVELDLASAIEIDSITDHKSFYEKV